MIATMIAEPTIDYRLRRKVGGHREGAHPGRTAGQLGVFRDLVPFMVHPDARRIDVRATVRDPFGGTVVRRFRQRVSIDVLVLIDLSASLAYEGAARKTDLAAELCLALARSVVRAGDRFGLIGFDARVREDCVIPLTRHKGVPSQVEALLRSLAWERAGSHGLLEAAARLGTTPKLVFLISDFFVSLPLLRRGFEALARHDVVPVVLADSTEDAVLPDWGLLDLQDLETGAMRTVFMRPALKRRWQERQRQRRAALWQLARAFARTPILVADRFDADQFSRSLREA